MEKARILVFLLIFYSILSLIFIAVGESVEMQDIATEDFTIPYSDILQDVKLEQIETFKLGEYGLSDVFTFYDVYASNISAYVDDLEKKVLKPAYRWFPDFGKPLSTKLLERIGESRNIFDTGEEIYIYPHFKCNFINPGIQFREYITVAVFDAYSGKNVYADVVQFGTGHLGILPTNEGKEYIKKLHLGKMGKSNYFYVIDIIYSKVIIENLNPLEVISILWEDPEKVEVERYGGVIFNSAYVGENATQDYPTVLQYHELNPVINNKGVWGGITRILNLWTEGYKTFTDTEKFGFVGQFMGIVIFSPIIFIISYIVYTEIRSWIPFLRGD